ncbi:MAG: hypothetical protein IJU76_03680 [Desulfovibrionaceae bacterium]|nr:hypothetical protein [Desulfovibrionaceae bacterium]
MSVKALLPALLGLLFCLWRALGFEASFCSLAGCTLYEDTKLLGLSLWWYGAIAFGLLSLIALARQKTIGRTFAASVLTLDTALLILLAATAPCTHCLLVGALFALTFLGFYSPFAEKKGYLTALFGLWLFFFGINLWASAKTFMGPWAILGEPREATIHIYFSPSCPKCRDVVTFYAGNLSAAFYPVAESESDIQTIRAMEEAIQKGAGIDEALRGSLVASAWNLGTLTTALRTLENKAHVLLAGSSGIPYIEFRGMPSLLAREMRRRREENTQDGLNIEVLKPASVSKETLPPELLGTEGQCVRAHCP